jgi:Chitin binding Peritrophin-A domain
VYANQANRTNCQGDEDDEDEVPVVTFECPRLSNKKSKLDRHPRYPSPDDCQKYFVCLNGVDPSELSCSSGKVYNEETKSCDDPANVEGCENWFDDQEEKEKEDEKVKMQAPSKPKGDKKLPKVNFECPRQTRKDAQLDRNPRYPSPDDCQKYFVCLNGVDPASELSCPSSKVYNGITKSCDDPAKVKGCELWFIEQDEKLAKEAAAKASLDVFKATDKEQKAEEKVPKVDFECPRQTKKNARLDPNPQYPSPDDCQKYFVCLNGVDPSELSCPEGEVYNEVTRTCDNPANVEGCEEWFTEEE